MPIVSVGAPWDFALGMGRLEREVLCKLRRVAFRSIRQSKLKVLVKVCIRRLFFSGDGPPWGA